MLTENGVERDFLRMAHQPAELTLGSLRCDVTVSGRPLRRRHRLRFERVSATDVLRSAPIKGPHEAPTIFHSPRRTVDRRDDERRVRSIGDAEAVRADEDAIADADAELSVRATTTASMSGMRIVQVTTPDEVPGDR